MHTLRRCLAPILLALALAAVPAARAQVFSPNPAPTIITTAPYTITQPGSYQLGANLYYGGNPNIPNDAIITINVGNVTLDFGEHYISGPSNAPDTGLYGVYAYNKGNLNIQNGSVVYCYQGINMDGPSGATTSLNINQRINNMLASYCYHIGINTSAAYNSDVTNCRVSFIGGTSRVVYNEGIYAGSGTVSNCEVYYVTASQSNAAVGFYLGSASLGVGNRASTCYVGYYGGKLQNNLTVNCTTTFSVFTDAGGNY